MVGICQLPTSPKTQKVKEYKIIMSDENDEYELPPMASIQPNFSISGSPHSTIAHILADRDKYKATLEMIRQIANDMSAQSVYEDSHEIINLIDKVLGGNNIKDDNDII